MGKAKGAGGAIGGSMSGMGGKNGVGFPKKASMATGGSGIKGPTKLGKNIKGGKGMRG